MRWNANFGAAQPQPESRSAGAFDSGQSGLGRRAADDEYVPPLAVVERLKEKRLATLDRRHFTVMRLVHVDALELVPV